MAWHSGKTVDALWSNEQPANVWVWIDGAWRKLQDANADACTNFAILAAHAKGAGRTVDALIEDERVKEMYVW